MTDYKYLILANDLKDLAHKHEERAVGCDFFLKRNREDYEQSSLDYYTERKEEAKRTAKELLSLSRGYAAIFMDSVEEEAGT